MEFPCQIIRQSWARIKPVRIIPPFPAGTATDISARIVGQKFSEIWGKPVIIENVPGAAGSVGAERAAKSAPDGYTLFILSTAHTINPGLYAKLAYDPVRDFAPVTMLVATSQVLVVHNSVPVKTVKEIGRAHV